MTGARRGDTASALPTHDDVRFAVFDLDRTLVAGSSLARLGRMLLRDGQLDPSAAAAAFAHELVFARWGASDRTAERVQRRLLALAAGRSYDQLARTALEAAETVAASVYAEGRTLLQRHADAGAATIIVSASPHELVAAVAGLLGATAGVGTRIEVVDGTLTGRLTGDICYGPGKLTRIAEELGDIDLRRAVAYSDSASDLPLLHACASAVAANPDRRLRAAARRAGWPVVRFGR